MLRLLKDVYCPVPVVLANKLSDCKISNDLKITLQQTFGAQGYGFDDYTSFAITDKEKDDRPANFALIPNQYLLYAALMYDFANEVFKYTNLFDKVKQFSTHLVGNSNEICNKIISNDSLLSLFENNEDVELFSKFIDKDNNEYRFGAKRFINDSDVPRGTRDCFTSVILKVINLPDVSSSIFGRLVFDLCSQPEVYKKVKSEFQNQNKNTTITSSSNLRNFVYTVISYIFENNIEEKLIERCDTEVNGQGIEHLYLNSNGITISRLFRKSTIELTETELTSGNAVRYFPRGFHKNGTHLYLTNQWANTDANATNSRDVGAFAKVFNELYSDLVISFANGEYQLSRVGSFVKLPKIQQSLNKVTNISKPFLLLAGISGTGKSRFVRKQAEAQGSEREYFQLVPVRPDWHEPSDLLGYVSRIGGKPKFVVTDALRFIVKAWRASAAEAITLSNGNIGWWSNTSLEDIRTYWLCLDEMNLAPVEQYFADYLSVIESRCWLTAAELADTGKEYMYQCAAIVSASSLNAVEESDRSGLAKELGLNIEQNEADSQLWNNFQAHGIPIPFNLVVAGTVNMDETTHGFSRKVIDRALTFDFGRFFPNDFNQLWAPETQPKTLQYSRFSHATKDVLQGCAADPDGQNSIVFLQSINGILRNTPFELAYRALNELLLAVICHQPATPAELQAVWDDFLMCKILPRIEGDDEKLSIGDASNSSTLLDEMYGKLSTLFADIWEQPRPDLFREALTDDQSLTVPCRSKEKLQWMKQRLERNSFTSFWP